MRGHTLVVMESLAVATVLALSVSADALACGFGAGASRLKVPLRAAVAAATVSALFVLFGMTAGRYSAPFLPESVQMYVSFFVLATFGLVKLASGEGETAFADCNFDRRLSVAEGAALGSALSVDGLAAGFGYATNGWTCAATVALTFLFTTGALYLGAKGGHGARGTRAGNVTAGLALVILAAEKLWGG